MPVLVERRGSIAVLTIDRPERRNALDPETSGQLGTALLELAEDDTRAVVLTGAGDEAFCSGMDLRAFARDGPAAPAGPGVGVLNRAFYPKPLVAAVNGAAVAGGFDVVLSCDLVVAAEHATFGLPEVKRGLVSGGGGTRLAHLVPLAVALEIAMAGATIDAARAYQLGLVNRVVPREQVLPEAIALAEQVAANGPLAVQVTKRLLWEEVGLNAPGRWERVGAATAPVFASDDAKEGARAFAEKRAPRWTGH